MMLPNPDRLASLPSALARLAADPYLVSQFRLSARPPSPQQWEVEVRSERENISSSWCWLARTARKYAVVGVLRRGNAWCVVGIETPPRSVRSRVVRSFRFRVARSFQMSDLLCMVVVDDVCAAANVCHIWITVWDLPCCGEPWDFKFYSRGTWHQGRAMHSSLLVLTGEFEKMTSLVMDWCGK